MARTTRTFSTLIACASMTLLAFGPPAFAGKDDLRRYLTAAERLFHNLENERALEQVQRAKQFANGVEDDALIALYEGTILVDLGRKDDANAAFRTALLLAPKAKLPMKVSPKIQREFEALRAAVERELAPIQARREEEQRKLAEARRLEEEQKRKEEEARRAEEARKLAFPARSASEAGSGRTSLPAAATPSAEVRREKGPKVLPFVLSGAAVAVAGAGSVFGMMAQQQHQQAREATFQDERVRFAGASQQSATLANTLFGVAAATAVGAVLTFAL